VKLLAEGETCASDTVVHSCFSVQLFFVLCLENSANCQSDDNRMIFDEVVSILLGYWVELIFQKVAHVLVAECRLRKTTR